MHCFDNIQGYRFARDTLLNTPASLLPEVIRNLRASLSRHPAQYAAGIARLLDEVKPK